MCMRTKKWCFDIRSDFCTGGTNNSSFNGRTTSWQKRQRIKKRVVKKSVGAKTQHLKTVEGVSGKRTGKSQRKAERRERRLQGEKNRVDSSMDIDGERKSTENSLGLALKKVGAGKKVYGKLLPSKGSPRKSNKIASSNQDSMIE